MKKILIILLFTFSLTACHNNEKNDPTLELELVNTPYYSEEYMLDEDKIGVVVASKIYDTETGNETGRIIIYVQGEEWHNEVFLSWTENFGIIENCTDKDCLEYLLYDIFQLQKDDFLNETLNYFSEFDELDKNFILKRREFEGYNDFLKIDISQTKDVQIYSDRSIIIEQGKKDQLVIESHLYQINIE